MRISKLILVIMNLGRLSAMNEQRSFCEAGYRTSPAC
jgi:hypothetical protein